MNSSHTPGPWRVGDAGAVIFGPKSDRPSPVTVAAVGRAGGNPDQARANARLISAAPELLAALQGLMEWESIMGGWEGTAWTKARAAIAKATGRLRSGRSRQLLAARWVVAGADEPEQTTMKLPLNATTVPNLDRALRAIPRHALERFADRVFTLLYLECEHPKSEMEVNPDKEWTQDTIEEVDSALLEILDPRGGSIPRRPKPTFQDRATKLGYTTLGHLLDMAVESDRVTKKEAAIAMKAWEKEDAHSPDVAWDNTAGPCLDRIASIVKQIAANPNETPKL